MILRGPRRALGVIAAAIILVAWQASEGWAALTYDISLGAGARLDDNLHLDPRTPSAAGLRQPVKETIFTIDPGMNAAWSEGRDFLRLNYHGEYSMYQGDEALDPLWVHNIAANLNWRRWSPFFLEARETRSRVPRTQNQDGEAYIDQVDRNLVYVRTGLFSEMGPRSTVELAYRGELVTYPGDDTADRVQRHYGEAMVRHSWTPLWGSALRVSYGQVDRRLASDFAELKASLAVDQRWSEQIALQYNLQWIREDNDAPSGAVAATAAPVSTVRTKLLMAAEITGALERGGSWTLAYSDRLADQPDGDTLKAGRASAATSIQARLGSTLDLGAWHETREYRESGRKEEAWGPTLGVRWLITPSSAFDLAASWTSTTIREVGLAELEDRTTRAAAGLMIMLFKRVQLEAGYGYRKNDATDALRSYVNNQVFALVKIHFRPDESGRLPPSYASGLVTGGTPSGGAAQAGAGGVVNSVQ